MFAFLRRGAGVLGAWLQRYPESVLVAASLWFAGSTLAYGLAREAHSYQPDMLPAAGVLAVALFLLGWAHPALFLLAALPLGVLNAVYAHVAHFWRIGVLEIRVETALDSSPGESRAFLRRFVLQSKFAWALILGYLGGGLALWALYAWARCRSPRRPGWRSRTAALVAALLLLAWQAPILEPYPAVTLGVTTYKVYTRVNPILARNDFVTATLREAAPLVCNDRYDKIIFVLGESANRDFMSLYGYPYPTTPFLDTLPNKVYTRAISPVNQTMTAVPIEFTPATVTDYDAFYTSLSIVGLLRRCGYETFWYSNQLRYSPYTSSVSSIAREAHQVHFLLDELPEARFGMPDEYLLKLFTPETIVPGRKQAFFFHLLGSHFDWKDRYPPDQALFPEPQDLREIYANTIYYTDRVLARIFERFASRSQNMLFVYTSDHGEWITPDKGGHAFSQAFQDEYRIPLVFWSTQGDDLAPLAQALEGRLVNTENLDRQIRFLVGLDAEPGVSYRTLVLSLGPGRVRDYTQLPARAQPETP